MLPSCEFLGAEVTRLIIGDNPFNGHSYITDTLSSKELLDFHTEEKILEALFEAESAGYNTLMPLADPFILRTLRHYRLRGGSMRLIFQPYPAVPLETNLTQMMQLEPLAIYHQGTTTDYLYESGKLDTLRSNLQKIRECGVPVGLGTHCPEVIRHSEREGWDADFYVACLQNARRDRKNEQSGFITGKSKQDLRFYPEDRPLMLRTVGEVQKPCVVFKIFAGGQIFSDCDENGIPGVIRSVYREVFSQIKPGDIAAVGVYQGRKDQIGENAKLLEETMRDMVIQE